MISIISSHSLSLCSELLLHLLTGDFEVFAFFLPLVMVCHNPAKENTITTTGSSCQLEGYTQEWANRSRNVHTLLPVHTNQTQAQSYTLDRLLSVHTLHAYKGNSDAIPALSVVPPPYISCDGTLHGKTSALHPPKAQRQSFDTILAKEVNPHPAGQG